MRTLLRSLSLAFVMSGCATAAAPPPASAPWPTTLDHPSTPATHRAAASELFTVTHIEQTFQAGLDQAVRTQITAQPALRELEHTMRAFFDRYMSFDSIRERFLALYTEAFSELELRQMTAFYRTPVGERAVQEIPELMRRGGEIGAEQVRAHQSELADMIREEMQRRGTTAPHAP